VSPRLRVALLLALCGAAALAVAAQPRLPQSPAYHDFADARPWLGVPRGADVLSNLGFLLACAAGLRACRRRAPERALWAVLFAGVVLTAFGSAWYHLAPDHERLVWDRLPMTLGFMGLLAATIAERVDLRWGRRLLGPLLFAGLASVVAWIAGERRGDGELRPYVLVQFLSLLAVAGLLALFPRRYTHAHLLWLALAGYALAKLCESLDRDIFAATGALVSGHTLKHLLAAGAVGLLAAMLARRERLA
jgi:hypothetical protein